MPSRGEDRLKGEALDSYLKLVTAFPLASIRSEEQLHEAQKVMDQLLAGGALKGAEEIYLDALGDLVATYEDGHHAIERQPSLCRPDLGAKRYVGLRQPDHDRIDALRVVEFDAVDRHVDLRAVGASKAQGIADAESFIGHGHDAGDQYGAATTDRECFFDGEEVTRHHGE